MPTQSNKFHSIARSLSSHRKSLFLAALLDTLGASIQRALAASLGSQILTRLLVCEKSAWAISRHVVSPDEVSHRVFD